MRSEKIDWRYEIIGVYEKMQIGKKKMDEMTSERSNICSKMGAKYLFDLAEVAHYLQSFVPQITDKRQRKPLLIFAISHYYKFSAQTLLFLLFSFTIVAQSPQKTEINLDEFIQKVFPVQQENINYDDLYESLYQLYQNPVDLNQANADVLRSLYVLSELQINSLLLHRQRTGDLLSIYELQAVPNFDLTIIRQILPFVVVRNRLSSESILGAYQRATEHYLVVRSEQVLEQSRAYQENKYVGSPQKYYTRYRLNHPKDFSIGFTSEKDPGEKNFADFYTFHAQIKNKGHWKNILLGDYQAQFGQGLICSAGFMAGKGGEPIYTTRRSNLGVRPYNSIIEGNFFRGGTATYQLGLMDLTVIYSNTRRDASINDETGEREDYVSSILNSGLHRTETEVAQKGTIREQNVGVNASFKINNGNMGFTVLNTNFDNSLQKQPYLYNKFEFSGKKNLLMGTNFSYNWQNFNFFGELARSSSGGVGALLGLVSALSKQVEWSLNMRHYDKNFHSFYANAFGEASRTINEQGIYWGLKYTPNRKLIFSTFYDRFKFPWLRYQVDAPSSGYDYLFRATYKPNKKLLFWTQFHEEHKQKNLPNNLLTASVLTETIRQNFTTNFEYTINRIFKIQSRLQLNSFQYITQKRTYGYAIIQDIEGKIKQLQLRGRLAYFATDDYDTRIYSYENDVLYAVSMPAYYGKGFRTYLVARYPVTRKIDIWGRIARTQLSNQSTLGSGNDQISLPHRTDVKLQLRYSF